MKSPRDSSLFVTVLLAIVFACTTRAFSAPPEVAKPTVDLAIYGHVVQVGWVVKDLDRVVDYWERLGLNNVHRDGLREFPDIIYHGKKGPLTVKTAYGRIGGVQIEWIEPVKGQGVYEEFLRKHGEGVHHLSFAVASPEQFDAQIKYFKSKGVGVVEQGSCQGPKGTGLYAYFDTAAKGGGLTIELLYNPNAPPSSAALKSQNEYPFNEVVQYAIVVRDVKKVAAFYERLGFGGMPVDHNVSVDRNYRGQPGKFEMYLGWWRFGDVTFEWIQSLVGPNVYEDALKAHGEGFHHLAFDVKDMDEAVKLLEAKGAPVSMSGGWDSPDSKGRFAYLDTEPNGGISIELLWNQPM